MSNMFKKRSQPGRTYVKKADFRGCQPTVSGASKSSKFLGVKNGLSGAIRRIIFITIEVMLCRHFIL